MKQMLKLFFLWAITTGITYIIAGYTFTPNEIFIADGIETEAIVINKDAENHQSITYSYIVNGEKFTGTGRSGFSNPSFENIHIGQKIIVFYDSKRPENSISGDPKRHTDNNLTAIGLFTLIGPIFIIWGLFRKNWI